jgi:hypothetical protein
MYFDLFQFENGSLDFVNLLSKCSLGIDLSVCKVFFWDGHWFGNHVLAFHDGCS